LLRRLLREDEAVPAVGAAASSQPDWNGRPITPNKVLANESSNALETSQNSQSSSKRPADVSGALLSERNGGSPNALQDLEANIGYDSAAQEALYHQRDIDPSSPRPTDTINAPDPNEWGNLEVDESAMAYESALEVYEYQVLGGSPRSHSKDPVETEDHELYPWHTETDDHEQNPRPIESGDGVLHSRPLEGRELHVPTSTMPSLAEIPSTTEVILQPQNISSEAKQHKQHDDWYQRPEAHDNFDPFEASSRKFDPQSTSVSFAPPVPQRPAWNNGPYEAPRRPPRRTIT